MLFEGKDRRELQQAMKSAGRLPPGQSLTLKWPVLHYGSVPRFDPKTWDFRVYGLVESPLKLPWNEFNALPKVQRTSDFHCVTRWSRFENHWDGVAFQELLRGVKPKSEAAYVLIDAEQGFTSTRARSVRNAARQGGTHRSAGGGSSWRRRALLRILARSF